MPKLDSKTFWEDVNYSTNLGFGKYAIEKVFRDEEILNKTVLDAGCGTGAYSLVFKQKGARNVAGIDFSESAIRKANKELERVGFAGVRFVNSNIKNHDFHGESFDIIWCYGVVYYSTNPYDIMRKLCDLTSRGGTLFVTFMKNTNYSKLINSVRKILYRIPKKLRGFTSLFISLPFFLALFIFNRETSFSRIRTKVLAQYFPMLSYFSVEDAEAFFVKNGFRTEKIFPSLDIFSYTTEFGLKAKKLG